MSVLPIIEYPDQILRKTAKPVVNFDKSLTKLVEDMINTLHDSQGIGLAANQIGVLLRIIVLQMPDENNPRVFINPEIIDHDGNRKVVEGCLSVPGYHGYVFRSLWVKAVGLNNKSQYKEFVKCATTMNLGTTISNSYNNGPDNIILFGIITNFSILGLIMNPFIKFFMYIFAGL